MKTFKLRDSTRIDFMDIGKCIAILLVVLTHVLQRTVYGYTGKDGWGSVLILMLAVPPFFFFSGMSYRLKKPLSPLGFLYDIIRRTFLYLLPFIWFILLRMWIYDQWPTFNKAWDDLMLYPVSGLWVCWIMLWISLVLDIGLFISYFFPKLKVLFVSLSLIIGFIILMILRHNGNIQHNNTIGYDYFIIYGPVFLVGYLVGPYILKIKNIYLSIACVLIGFGCLVPIAIYNHPIITAKFLMKSQWMMYLACFCSIVFYFGLINLIQKLKFSNVFAFFGQFTMEMYFLHLMLIKHWKGMHLDNNWIIFWTSLGLFMLCLVNTLAVVVVTYFIPFLHFIMFGKHYSYYEFENNFFNKIKDFCYSNGRLKTEEGS